METFVPVCEGAMLACINRVLEKIKLVETVERYIGKKTHKSTGSTVSQRIVAMVINRLLSPQPLYKVSDWYRQSGLESCFGVDASQFDDDSLAHSLEKIAERGDFIINEISANASKEYDIRISKVYHDVTSVSFEGEYNNSSLVKYGYSRDRRPDLKQINIHLDVDPKSNVPVGCGIHPGNSADTKTTLISAENVKCNYPAEQITLIGDEAMHDIARLEQLDEDGFKFVVGGKRTERIRRELLQVNKECLRTLCGSKSYKGRVLIKHFEGHKNWRAHVIYSPDYEQRQRQTRAAHIDKVNRKLDRIMKLVGKKWYDTPAKISDKVWQILNKYRDVKKYYIVRIGEKEVSFNYEIDKEKLMEDEKLDGVYVLIDNTGLKTSEVLNLYKTKSCVDVVMRQMKSHLRVSPIFLKKDERIKGMGVIWYLALLVRGLLEYEVNRKITKDVHKQARRFPSESVRRAFAANERGDYRITFEIMSDVLARVWIFIKGGDKRWKVSVMQADGLAQTLCSMVGVSTSYIISFFSGQCKIKGWACKRKHSP